jgi:hypothetical protein
MVKTFYNGFQIAPVFGYPDIRLDLNVDILTCPVSENKPLTDEIFSDIVTKCSVVDVRYFGQIFQCECIPMVKTSHELAI